MNWIASCGYLNVITTCKLTGMTLLAKNGVYSCQWSPETSLYCTHDNKEQ